MARTNMNIPDDVDREMRHEAVDLGLRYPGEFVQHLWKTYTGVEKMNEKEFAKELGFTDYSDLCEKSEVVYEEPGDITWFITELPDGRWAAWDDAEISPHRVAYFDSRDEAVAFQQSGIEIVEREGGWKND